MGKYRKPTKTFNGRVYALSRAHQTKEKADKSVRKWRENGFPARAVHVGDEWLVYALKRAPLSPRSGGGKGTTHVRSHARKGTKGIRAHTRKR